jgi:Carboxypeptidase regulatory-like domain/TonB dependent receptor-like, beta-barrel
MAHARKLPLALILLAISALAAEHRGKVEFGGLPVPGVTVTATRGDQTFTAVTDPQGAYVFPDLPEGTWKFHIEMLGFAVIDRDVTVAPGAPADAWDLQMLPIGAMNATAASPPATPSPAAQTAGATSAAQTTGTTPATAPSRSRLRSRGPAAPTNTQTPFQRAEVNATAAAAPPPDPAANQNSGELAQRASDGFLINGTTNNAATSPFSISQAFGNNRRGQRSLYNGNLGFTFDNSTLDARPYSLTGQDTPRPAYGNFTGLASFGGPLRIPRLLHNGPNVFVNYQWTRNRNANTASALMPTLAERSGDFSQVLTPLGQPVTVIDPSTSQPFFGNVIPTSRFSPQAAALLHLYPLPNFDGTGGYNYQVPLAGITHQDSLQSRVNQVVNPANQIFGGFAMQSTRTDTPNVFQFLDTGSTLGLNAGVNWRHRFTPRFFGTFGFQFSRQAVRTTPFFSNRENIAGAAGITGNNQDPVNWGPPSLNFASGIQALSDAAPSSTRNQTSAVSLSGLWNRGRHNLQFGADFRRQEFNLLSQQDPRGTFGFTGAAAGYDFAGFLLGIPDTSSIAFGNADKYFRATNYDAYFTDDWRLAPNFTLNAGARWEYWSPITERYGRLVNLDIAPGYAAETPVLATNPTGALTGRHYPGSLMNPDKHGIQPRVGFSWRPLPASSLLVRGGYGVYYNTSVYFPIASQMAQQSPLSKSLSVSNTAANPLTLANGFLASPDITTNTFAVDPNLRIGYAQIWTTSVQRDLPRSMVLIVSYTGTKGTRGMQEFLPNTYPAGAANPCPTCPSGFIYLASNGNSARESGQAQLRRRLRAGFTAELDYTFSKSIDDSSLGGRTSPLTPVVTGPGAAPQNGAGSAPVIAQNWLNLSAERALSNFDQRHLASLVLQYTTGMGIGGGTLVGGWRSALFKEWTFLSNVSAGTGLPLTPVYVTPVRGTGITGSVRPEYTGAPLYAASPGAYLNPAAYTAPLPGQWGDAGRNSITGPSQFTWNASLGRTFRMNDRLNLDVRFDSTNTLNHVTFVSWNTTATSAQFGLPNATNAMRSVLTTVRLRF